MAFFSYTRGLFAFSLAYSYCAFPSFKFPDIGRKRNAAENLIHVLQAFEPLGKNCQ
jgi:hypothetical protein